MTIHSVIYVMKHLNVKTLYFNLRSFSFSTAIRFPVFLSRNVVLKDITGTFVLPTVIYPGIIKIGFGDVGIFDQKRSKTIWEVKGRVVFTGSANIGHGSKISVGTKGVLSFGNRVNITAESSIVCFHQVSFGDDCLLSWEILVMDTDFHKIYKQHELLNEDRPIDIASKVWIGARATILKGTSIAEGTVVAAGSLVNKSFVQPNIILAGSPAKIVNEHIEWKL